MQEVSRQKVFIAYTTLDKEINKNLLIKIENKFKIFFDVYIDLLHNDNSIQPQQKVIDELNNSDILIVLNTNNIKNSKWVKIELQEAKAKNKTIKFFNISDILNNNFEFKCTAGTNV